MNHTWGPHIYVYVVVLIFPNFHTQYTMTTHPLVGEEKENQIKWTIMGRQVDRLRGSYPWNLKLQATRRQVDTMALTIECVTLKRGMNICVLPKSINIVVVILGSYFAKNSAICDASAYTLRWALNLFVWGFSVSLKLPQLYQYVSPMCS